MSTTVFVPGVGMMTTYDADSKSDETARPTTPEMPKQYTSSDPMGTDITPMTEKAMPNSKEVDGKLTESDPEYQGSFDEEGVRNQEEVDIDAKYRSDLTEEGYPAEEEVVNDYVPQENVIGQHPEGCKCPNCVDHPEDCQCQECVAGREKEESQGEGEMLTTESALNARRGQSYKEDSISLASGAEQADMSRVNSALGKVWGPTSKEGQFPHPGTRTNEGFTKSIVSVGDHVFLPGVRAYAQVVKLTPVTFKSRAGENSVLVTVMGGGVTRTVDITEVMPV